MAVPQNAVFDPRFLRQEPGGAGTADLSRTLTLSLDAPSGVVTDISRIFRDVANLVATAVSTVPGDVGDLKTEVPSLSPNWQVHAVLSNLKETTTSVSSIFSALPPLLIINSVLLIIALLLCIGLLVVRIITLIRARQGNKTHPDGSGGGSSVRSPSYRRSVEPSHERRASSQTSSSEAARPATVQPRSDSRNSRGDERRVTEP